MLDIHTDVFSERMKSLKGEVQHVHAEALHHHILHEATFGWTGFLETLATWLEGARRRRDWNDWDILTVAELNHVAIWVMEEHLVDSVSFIFYYSCHIPHSHLFQPPLHKPNVRTLLIKPYQYDIYWSLSYAS